MILIHDLTGICEDKRKEVIACLDELLTYRDSDGLLVPVISGYNWYAKLTKSDRVITFSNIHETESYKEDMLRDLEELGYDHKDILNQIREKAGAFIHDLEFRLRDDDGNLLPGLRIKDTRTGKYIDLENYQDALINYQEFTDAEGCLIDEDQGWELDMPFKGERELMSLVNLFLKKSGKHIYDVRGNIIKETDEEQDARAPWSDAYKVPVLLLGETALRYADKLPQFVPVTKFALKENNNEISFIIHNNIKYLKSLNQYTQLLRFGFAEEECLGNKPFIRYVDEI
ncbi:hypothetical protein KY346_06500 [Candidatus Woesearchaeota archaeon]|nr:hypothetical protein [Candidatus Woesearchaeota archaeon]